MKAWKLTSRRFPEDSARYWSSMVKQGLCICSVYNWTITTVKPLEATRIQVICCRKKCQVQSGTPKAVLELGLWNSLPTVALASGGERACVAETAMGIIIRQSLWLKIDICSTNPWNWVTGSWDHEIVGIIYSSGPWWCQKCPKKHPQRYASWGRDHWILCRITSCESTAKPMNRKVIQQLDENGSWRQSLLMMILIFDDDIDWCSKNESSQWLKRHHVCITFVQRSYSEIRFLWHSRPFYQRFRSTMYHLPEWSRWRLPARLNV